MQWLYETSSRQMNCAGRMMRSSWKLAFWTLTVVILVTAQASVTLAQSTTSAEGAAVTMKTYKPSAKEVLTPPEAVKAADGQVNVVEQPPTIDFAILPNQFEDVKLWSMWGDTIQASDGNYYAAIGNHDAPHGTSYVYRIDPTSRQVKLVIDINQVIGRADKPDYYTPGKIHAPLMEGNDGNLYILTYRGSTRQTTDAAHYEGGWLLRYNLKTGKTENLGHPLANHSFAAAVLHKPTMRIYAFGAPGKNAPAGAKSNLFIYDIKSGKAVFHGGPTPDQARSLLVANDGSAYYTADGKFVRYDPEQNQVKPTDIKVPGDGNMRAVSHPLDDGTAIGITKQGTVFKFNTQTQKIESFGDAFVTGRLYTAIVHFSPDGRYAYYVPSAHGGASKHGTAIIQLDVKTGRKRVVAFLNNYFRDKENYNLGGTFGLSVGGKGDELFILWNGNKLGDEARSKNVAFGLCSVTLLHLPSQVTQP